jgi:D-3-phosphoglycerate dehydrogenase
MLIGLSKNIVKANTELVAGDWKRENNRGLELKGRTMGIIGYGHTGSAFAEKLRGFGMRVLVHDKYKSGFSNDYIEEVSLDYIMRHADVISFHVPYTKETHHMINEKFITSCGKKPVIINTSRGAIARTPDLLQALHSKSVRGLCSDVFEDEPFDRAVVNEKSMYEELIGFPNVIATPHVAGWSKESWKNLTAILMVKILENLD